MKITKRRPRNLLLLFQILTIGLLLLYNVDHLTAQEVYLTAGLVILVYASNFLVPRISDGDQYIFLIVTMLMSIGIIMVYRINPAAGLKQLQWVLFGLFLFYLTYFVVKSGKFLRQWFWTPVILSFIFFGLTLVFGRDDYGATNWIHIGSITLQLSEITKLLLLWMIAVFYTNDDALTPKPVRSLYFMGINYVFLLLFLLQRDLGTAMIFAGVFTGTQFVYEKNRKLWKLNVILLVVGAVLAYLMFYHVKVRFSIWRDPWKVADKEGYQIIQSLFALAAGGFFGAGIAQGVPTLIPKVEFDFIFSAICEEMGLFMGIAVILLYLILFYRGIKITLEQEKPFLRVLALGVTLLFGMQAFVAIGGVIKFIPMTGITMPFVSYGGSSMISSFMALAFLLVASEYEEYEEDEYGAS